MQSTAVQTDPIDLQFQLIPADIGRAISAHYRSSFITWFLFLMVAIGCSFAGIYNLIRRQPEQPIVFPLILGVGAWILIPELFIFGPRRQFKKQPSLAAPQTFHADANAITIDSTAYRGTEAWSNYTHFLESPHLFLIYFAPRAFRIVPKRAFSSSGQLDQFRTLTSQHLRPRGFRFLI